MSTLFHHYIIIICGYINTDIKCNTWKGEQVKEGEVGGSVVFRKLDIRQPNFVVTPQKSSFQSVSKWRTKNKFNKIDGNHAVTGNMKKLEV